MKIDAQADKLQQERARNEARMKQPQNAAVLERATVPERCVCV